VLVDGVKPVANLRSVGRAGLGDGERHQMRRVVGIGDTDSRRHIGQRFDLRIFLLQRGKNLRGLRIRITGETEGLDELNLGGAWSCELAETAARGTPVR